jgi:hypothetical protein
VSARNNFRARGARCERFREEYGFSDVLASWIRGEPTIFRLTPR